MQAREAIDAMVADAAKRKLLEDKLNELPKTLAAFVTKEQFDEMTLLLKAENQELKDILLRVKAQGRAGVQQREKTDVDDLKKAYAGTGLEDLI